MVKTLEIKALKGSMISRNNSNRLTVQVGADVKGNVYKMKDNRWVPIHIMKTPQGNNTAKPVANVKYPSNLIISCYNESGKHTTVSLSRLFGEAFMVTPDSKYKVLLRNAKDTLYSPLNYFIYTNNKAVA